MTFDDLHLIDPILKAIKAKGYTNPTPIQAQAIPEILKGKDILGCAQTGTGKTAAFAIPTLQRLDEARKNGTAKPGIKALIVTPTRELAIQIDENFRAYGSETGFRNTVIFGGVKQHAQVRKIQSGIDILIATPGRLLDLMNQKIVQLSNLEIFILDEADRMLDMGFIHDVKKIIAKIPRERQSLFFSATMPPAITSLANSMLKNPRKIEVTPVSSTAESVHQALFTVKKDDKRALLSHILEHPDIPTALVFTRTKYGADKLVKFLNQNGTMKAEAIHGNKSQNARQRALSNFKSRSTQVLVATDIAARGIDIDSLSHVINFEIPNEPETYVHRIGRTGRASNTGVAMSFCDHEEQTYVRDIQRLINKPIPLIDDHPYHAVHQPHHGKPQKNNQRQRHGNGRGRNGRR